MKLIAAGNEATPFLKNKEFLSCFSFDILPYVRVVSYEKKESIFRSNETLTRLLYLEEGTAKLYGFHRNGRRSLINFFTPPCVLGGTELFNQNKAPFPLVAQTPCQCIEIDTQRCENMLLSDAVFLRSLCRMILNQNVAQHRRYMNLAAYPSRNNLADCLLLLQNDGLFVEQYTEIADYLSISYRHLMHLISEMCEEGLLERVPEGLRILDFDRLRMLADEICDDENQ